MLIENRSLNETLSSVGFLTQVGWIYVFLGFTILMVLFRNSAALARYINETISPIRDWLVRYALAKPIQSILFVGFFSSVVSCYPVVFFSKSFVHPVGVFALYNKAPLMPGLPIEAEVEVFRGSDTGATAWSIAPNSVVQHDALFRYFEFPFWSRYVGAGIPLFAQGQSMIGDVLHWMPVFLDGSAVGWDTKFVLSKAIFAIGMGLLVFRLTENLLAGSLIAISSCFLGFFAYRFNHPTFFVLTYAPWVVLQWGRFGKVLALPNSKTSNCVLQSLLLAAATWLQVNSGATKEGVITACFVHVFGALVFWSSVSPSWGRMRTLIYVCYTWLAMVMLTAPYWLLFLDLLGKSYTGYDSPQVQTLPWWLILAFFDNAFYQQHFGGLRAPSVNLFVFICLSSALLSLRFPQPNIVHGAWGLFALAFAVAFGVIPTSILVAIPFINNIHHVGNTFSMPMMILALVLAGYGIRDYLLAYVRFKNDIVKFSLFSFLVLWTIFILKAPH